MNKVVKPITYKQIEKNLKKKEHCQIYSDQKHFKLMGGCCTHDKEPEYGVEGPQGAKNNESENINGYNAISEQIKSANFSCYIFTGDMKELFNLSSYFQKNEKALLPIYVHPYLHFKSKNTLIFQEPRLAKVHNKTTTNNFKELKVELGSELTTKNKNEFIKHLVQVFKKNEIIGYFSNENAAHINFIVSERNEAKLSDPEIVIQGLYEGFHVKNLEKLFQNSSNKNLTYRFSINIEDEVWLIFEKSDIKSLYQIYDISDQYIQNDCYQEDLSNFVSSKLSIDPHFSICGIVEHQKKRETYLILSSIEKLNQNQTPTLSGL